MPPPAVDDMPAPSSPAPPPSPDPGPEATELQQLLEVVADLCQEEELDTTEVGSDTTLPARNPFEVELDTAASHVQTVLDQYHATEHHLDAAPSLGIGDTTPPTGDQPMATTHVDVAPAAGATQPTNPVLDAPHCHYLLGGQSVTVSKPVSASVCLSQAVCDTPKVV